VPSVSFVGMALISEYFECLLKSVIPDDSKNKDCWDKGQ
jgi:hypothetical protein